MKRLFILLPLIFMGGLINAQHIISINSKQVLKLNEEDDNADENIKLNLNFKHPAAAVFEAKDLKGSKQWKRSYIIYDEQDNEILKLNASKKVNTQQVAIKELLKKLEAGKKYFLYTMATPSNPKLAAVVRVRRILLCAVIVQ